MGCESAIFKKVKFFEYIYRSGSCTVFVLYYGDNSIHCSIRFNCTISACLIKELISNAFVRKQTKIFSTHHFFFGPLKCMYKM